MYYRVKVQYSSSVKAITLAAFRSFEDAVDYMESFSKRVIGTTQVSVFEGRKLRVSKLGEIKQ